MHATEARKAMEPNFFDNKARILKDDLVVRLRSGDKISIAAAYFSIYGYRELKDQLEGCESLRFLYTEPTFLKEGQDKAAREFYIPRLGRERGVYGTDLEIKLRNEMTQRAVARECADWIRGKAEFRSLGPNQGPMQSFMAVKNGEGSYAYAPFDGLTAPAIGATPGSSQFTFIVRNEAAVSAELLRLFDQAWNDQGAVEDVTERVIESVEDMYSENPPGARLLQRPQPDLPRVPRQRGRGLPAA